MSTFKFLTLIPLLILFIIYLLLFKKSLIIKGLVDKNLVIKLCFCEFEKSHFVADIH
jgi:hypothetical protein